MPLATNRLKGEICMNQVDCFLTTLKCESSPSQVSLDTLILNQNEMHALSSLSDHYSSLSSMSYSGVCGLGLCECNSEDWRVSGSDDG